MMMFSVAQSGQVNLITYPVLVPVISGLWNCVVIEIEIFFILIALSTGSFFGSNSACKKVCRNVEGDAFTRLSRACVHTKTVNYYIIICCPSVYYDGVMQGSISPDPHLCGTGILPDKKGKFLDIDFVGSQHPD
jgi:hypothetical protein